MCHAVKQEWNHVGRGDGVSACVGGLVTVSSGWHIMSKRVPVWSGGATPMSIPADWRNRYIHPSTFQNQTKLRHLDISENKIISLKPDTCNYNRDLVWLSLANNTITDIHPSTFQQQDKLDHLEVSGNRLHSIKPDTFNFNRRLIWLSLARNNITHIDHSTVQNRRALHNLDISDNNVTTIHPDTFQYNWYLQWLSVANNRITDFDQRIFRNQTN